jgi:hypothetical protein
VTAVHAVVPAGIDDPARVSGGNRYDRRTCDRLRATGWTVEEIAAPGSWPHPGPPAPAELAGALDRLPDDALVLVDGLIASAAAAVLVPRSARLRLVVLVHMPLGGDAVPADQERAVLTATRAVVTTSDWTRDHLLQRYPLLPARVHVAHPGTDPAAAAPGTADGCSASPRSRRTRGRTSCSRPWPGSPTCGGSAPSPARWTAPPASSPRCRSGPRPRGSPRGSGSPARCPVRPCSGSTATPTSSCCPPAARRTAWSSPRRWPPACR